MFIDKAKAPAKILQRAMDTLRAWRNRSAHARKSKRHGYLILEIGYRFRLLFKGDRWVLLTHEQYNREVLI